MNHKIVFLEVKTSFEKISSLLMVAQKHFLNKHRLFLYSEKNAKKYLDDLLWKEPKQSFLPHAIDDPMAPIVITDSFDLLQNALFIFNLTPSALELFEPWKMVFELDDYSSIEKEILSKKKFETYSKKGFSIESKKLL